jgi:hypothetical protein
MKTLSDIYLIHSMWSGPAVDGANGLVSTVGSISPEKSRSVE